MGITNGAQKVVNFVLMIVVLIVIFVLLGGLVLNQVMNSGVETARAAGVEDGQKAAQAWEYFKGVVSAFFD